MKEDSIENPFHTVSVTKDTHESSPFLYFPECSFDKIGGADLSPQGRLDLLSEVSEGLSRGSQELRIRDRRFTLFLSGEAFCEGETGSGSRRDSKSPDEFVAEDPDYQSD